VAASDNSYIINTNLSYNHLSIYRVVGFMDDVLEAIATPAICFGVVGGLMLAFCFAASGASSQPA
jgi:hypothetical protein